MTPLSDQDLLHVWEYGLNHSVLETNLLLLSLVYPDITYTDVLSIPLGERDARLLSFRKRYFGLQFQNTSDCPVCCEKLEWETSVADMICYPWQNPEANPYFSLECEDETYQFRLPNSRDIMETIYQTEIAQREEYLLQKCIITMDKEHIGKSLSKEVKASILEKMEEADPQSNMIMNLSCPACSHKWDLTFDIMEYLWIEINDLAIQLMRDIYLLAKTFHWSEQEILQMNSFRKRLYLSMIKA